MRKPERVDEAGSIPNHAELFLPGVTANAISPSCDEDIGWQSQDCLNSNRTGVVLQ